MIGFIIPFVTVHDSGRNQILLQKIEGKYLHVNHTNSWKEKNIARKWFHNIPYNCLRNDMHTPSFSITFIELELEQLVSQSLESPNRGDEFA